MFWLSTKLKSILVLLKMNHNTSIDEIIRELEKVRIQEALKLANGQQKAAAKQLGVSASTLSKRLSKYNIDVTAYKSKIVRSELI
jgi:DNA-binding NtrC family response regulator